MHKILDLSCSIVLYKNDPAILTRAIASALGTNLAIKLYLIDNSPTRDLENISNDPRVVYRFAGANLGYGKAHNIAMREAVNQSRYHLILNPDVYFEKGTLESLAVFMNERPDVGLVMPKVVSFDNELQFLCKRLPTPAELVFRRFFPGFTGLIRKRMERYEMKDKDYNSIFEVPSLSGCFMFLRTEAIEKAGYFDEDFFMYLEDIDLSRRIFNHFKNIYYPSATIYHGHAKESYRSFRLLRIHVQSAIRYFNKWGWFFDKERERINENV